MNRFVLPVILALSAGARPMAAEQGQLDASPTLFTVMAALNAAGFDAEVDSPNNHPLRDAIRKELAAKNIPSLPRLKEFFKAHRLGNQPADLSPYISWALSVTDPPNFSFKGRDVEVPPDAQALDGFAPLLEDFYQEAGIADLWKRSQAAIESYLEWYHDPVAQAVLQVNTYLRHVDSSSAPGRFQVYVELLAPPNQVQTRNYKNDSYVVVTPSPEPQVHEIRHAYLHFLLDGLASRYAEIIERKRGLADHALRAPALPDQYKRDFVLLTSECLIKAVEARLDKNPAEAEQAAKEGFILTPYFSEQLPAYEKEQTAMRFYYPDMVKSIDLMKEDARLSKMQFVAALPTRTVKTTAVVEANPAAPVSNKTLEDADKLYEKRDLEAAKGAYLKLLGETDNKPLHARAYYGLARIAVLQRDPETGQKLFVKALDSEPEPYVRGWVLVYLGRLADAEGEPQQAAHYFQEALRVDGASMAARKAAEQGAKQSAKQQ